MMKKILRRLVKGPAAAETAPQVDFRALAEHSSDLIIQVGQDFRLRYVSPSATAILGWTPQEMMDSQGTTLHPDDLPLIQASMQKLAAGAPKDQIAYRVRRKNGDWVWLEGSASILQSGKQRGDLIVIARDVSERKRHEEELGQLAFQDKLTNIANRRKFDEVLENEWNRCLRDQGHMSLLLLDLDHFKGVNDRYGHQVGDDCLRSVAEVARSVVSRPADLVARYGGEEIAAILPDTDMEGALAIAEKIRQSIEALAIPNIDNKEGNGVVTVSIGAATAYSRTGGRIKMPEGLLMAVDHALYQAKHEGRNRVASSMLLMPAGEGRASTA